jgi:ADP-ribosylglycohydrolase
MNESHIMSIASRIRGSLYGVAVVDALGGPVEFHRRGTFAPVTGFRPNDNFNLPSGTWTDDTSMMLCLAQSLVDTKGVFVAQDQVRKYIQWYHEGYMSSIGYCFDIGNATRIALRIWKDFFESRPNMDRNDPTGHSDGQRLIDKALKHKVAK